jgi:hypothetical protein
MLTNVESNEVSMSIVSKMGFVTQVGANSQKQIGIIAGSVAGALIIIIAAIIIGILIHKCTKNRSGEGEMKPENNIDPHMAMTLENPLTDKGDADQREIEEDAWVDTSE